MDTGSRDDAAHRDPRGRASPGRARGAARARRGAARGAAALTFVVAALGLAGLAPAQEDPRRAIGAIERALRGGPDREVARELDGLIDELERAVLDGEPAAEPGAAGALAYAYAVRALRVPGAEPLAELPARIAPRGDPRLGARVLLETASWLVTSGRRESAAELLRAADEAWAGYPSSHVTIGALRAQLAREAGDLELASTLLARCEDELARVDDPVERVDLECDVRARHVELFLAQGLVDLAARELPRLQELGLATRVSALRDQLVLLRCRTLLASQRFAEIEALAEAELDALDDALRPMVRLHRAAARWELARVDPERWTRPARAALEELLEEPRLLPVDRVVARSRLADVALHDGDAEAVAARFAELEKALAAVDEPPLDVALYVAELRARRALDPACGTDEREARRAELADALERLLAAWSAAPRRPGGVGFLHYGSRRRALVTLMRSELAARPGRAGIEAALAHLFDVQARGSLASGRLASAWATLQRALERLLAPDRGLLVFVPGRDRTLLFALDATAWSVAELSGPASLEAWRADLAGLTAAGRAEDAVEVRALAEALGRELLPDDVRQRLRSWSHATIVGAALFGSLPFELLPAEHGPLGEVIALSVLPSLPLACAIDGPAARATDAPELALIAAPTIPAAHAGSLSPLSFGARQRERITRAFAGSARVWTADDACAAVLDDPAVGDARILCLITHGWRDPSRERGTGLVLAACDGEGDEGLMWPEAVEALRLPELVLVAACGAGGEVARKGEDTGSQLAGAFLAAGARAVVATPTRIDQAAALALLEVFLERLRGHGDAPAEALRRARAALAEDERFPSPAQRWVRLVGLGDRALFPR